MNIGRNHHRPLEAVWAPMGTVGRQLRQFLIGGGGKAISRGYWRGLRGIAGYWTLFGSSSGNSSRGWIMRGLEGWHSRWVMRKRERWIGEKFGCVLAMVFILAFTDNELLRGHNLAQHCSELPSDVNAGL